MNRPPTGPGSGGERYPADTGGSSRRPDEPPAPRQPSLSWPTDPDRKAGHPELRRPLPTDPAFTTDDSMPTEPIAVLPSPGGPGTDPRYEGDWADWMVSTDRYPPVPGRGDHPDPAPAEVAPEIFPADPARPGRAEPNTGEQQTPAAVTPPELGPATAGATARQRLRDRLTPDETPAPAPAPTPPARRGIRLTPVLLGISGVVAIGAATYVQFAWDGGDGPDTPPAANAVTPETTARTDPTVDPNCPAERIGSMLQGSGAGGTDSGTAAIFGFQHAYYVARSGEQARALTTPDTTLPPAADIQTGIDTIPPGTTHCVQISPGAFIGQYTVVIIEHRPGVAPLGYNPQFVTTRQIGDKTFIHGIGPMP